MDFYAFLLESFRQAIIRKVSCGQHDRSHMRKMMALPGEPVFAQQPCRIDIALVEPGPFPSNLLAAGKPPARADVLASYGDLRDVPTAMVAGFADMLASDQAPDPQLVVDTYLSLADAAPGKRPTRTVVGITWGVDEVNAFTQPHQDALLKEMQLDTLLGGADA